mgnify:CR=1 FL=1
MIYLNNLIEQNKGITDEKALNKSFQVLVNKTTSNNKKTDIEIIYTTLLANLRYAKKTVALAEIDSLYKKAISKSAKSSNYLNIWTNTEYGFYLYSNSLYSNAFPYFLTASKLIDKFNFKVSIQTTDVLKKNAFYFGSIENDTKEREYYKEALKIIDKKSVEYGAILNNLGKNYRKNGNNAQAEKYFTQTLAISKANNDSVRYAKALGDLALLHDQKGNWKKAEDFLLEDIAISKQHKSERNVMYAQIQLGNLYYKKHDYSKAILVLNEAENHAKSKSNLKSYEQQILKLKLSISINQKDIKTELKLRRKLDTLSQYVSKTDGHEVITKINLEAQKENIKLQLVAEKVKVKNELLFKKMSIAIGVVLILLLILLFIMNKRKLKYQQIEFDQKILSFQLDKNNSEIKLKETHNSLASYKTYLSEKTEQVEQLKEEIAKKDNSTSANNKKEVFKQLLNSHLLTEDNWLNFKNEFIKEQSHFYGSIIEKYPDLTESNLRMILLLKMGLSNQNIANLLGVTLEAVKKAKQRLKKKYENILKELE